MSNNLLGNLRVRLTAETEDFAKKIGNARQKLTTFEQDVQRFRSSTLGGAVSVGALVGGLGALVSRTADAADQIDKMAIRSGLARGTLQELKYIGDQVGVSFETLVESTGVLYRQLPQIQRGSGDASKAFKALGLSATDSNGDLRSMSELFPDIVTALSGVENETQRNVLATQLFGRKAYELIPLLDAGGDEVHRLTQRARDLGLVLSDETIAANVQFADKLAEVKAEMAGTGAQVATSLIPALTGLTPVVTTLADALGTAVEGWQMLGVEAAVAWETIKETFGNRKNFLSGLRGALGAQLKTKGIHLPFLDVTPDDFDQDSIKRLQQIRQAGDELRNEIASGGRSTSATTPSIVSPLVNPITIKNEGEKAAKAFYSGLEDEWENLRHSVGLRMLDAGATDSQHLALETAHELRLLDIEAQHLEARHKLKELTDAELAGGLRQVEIRRQIAVARQSELETANRFVEQQRELDEQRDIRLSDAIERERLSADTTDKKLAAVRKIYDLQRQALLADSRLSDAELETELLKLRLAKEREEITLAALKNAKTEGEYIAGVAGELQGMLPSGPGAGFGRIAGSFAADKLGLTSELAKTVIPGIGGLIAGQIGNLLFPVEKEQHKQTAALNRIDENTRQTAKTLELVNRATDMARGVVNVPAGFSLPKYTPRGSIQVTVNQNVTIAEANDPEAVVKTIKRELGPVLQSELRRLGA